MHVTFEVRGIPSLRRALSLHLLIALGIALLTFPTIELVGQLLMDRPQPVTAPPLADARVTSGSLHFTRGARDWREAELLVGPSEAISLRCLRYLASDACFHLHEAESLEGAQATVWLHSDAQVLQIRAGNNLVVPYADTVARLASPPDTRAIRWLAVYFGCFAAGLVLLVSVTKISIEQRKDSNAV
jgi:hypothetical protein